MYHTQLFFFCNRIVIACCTPLVRYHYFILSIYSFIFSLIHYNVIMFNFLKVLYIFSSLRKGREGRSEILEDVSFSFIENIFFISFFVVGLITGALAYLAYIQQSNIALFFAFLLFIVLIFDISLYLRIKRFFRSFIDTGVHYTEDKIRHFIKRENFIKREKKIIDIKEKK